MSQSNYSSACPALVGSSAFQRDRHIFKSCSAASTMSAAPLCSHFDLRFARSVLMAGVASGVPE